MRVLAFVHTFGEKNGISLHVHNLVKFMPKNVKMKVIAAAGNSLPFFSSLKLPANEFLQAMGEDFDVMHVHGYGNFFSFFGAIACMLKGRPLVWTIHGYPRVNGARKALYYVYRYFMAPFIFWKAARIISVSSDVVGVLAKETSKDIEVLHNGVDTGLFSPKKNYRQQEFACFVGRLDSDKGAGRMLECKHIPILFIGPDEDGNREKLRAQAQMLGRDVRFAEVGYRDMPSAYEKCRYVVLPSKYEGFPLTLLEAVAMERPFVCTDVGEVKKTMRTVGLPQEKFILKGNVGETLQQLEKSDWSGQLKAARKKLGAYSWKTVGARMEKIYRSVLSPTHARSPCLEAGVKA